MSSTIKILALILGLSCLPLTQISYATDTGENNTKACKNDAHDMSQKLPITVVPGWCGITSIDTPPAKAVDATTCQTTCAYFMNHAYRCTCVWTEGDLKDTIGIEGERSCQK